MPSRTVSTLAMYSAAEWLETISLRGRAAGGSMGSPVRGNPTVETSPRAKSYSKRSICSFLRSM